MTLQLGDTAPDFEAETTHGRISFHDWIGDKWAVLFSHPKDFTPVCTTELGHMAKIKPEFDRRGVKILGLSVDPVDAHARWAADIEQTQGAAPNYPVIADSDFTVSKLYGMLPASTSGDPAQRTPADNQTVRNVFVIGPDKKVNLILVYPMTTGRNFDELLRVIDSLQLTARHKVSTPVNWRQGEDVIIAGSVSDEEAKQLYPRGWKAPRPYIRIVPQPDRSATPIMEQAMTSAFPDWRQFGVRTVRRDQLDSSTPQTPGMHRLAAISRISVGAERIWAGTVTIQPGAQTGPHHHGPLESVIYVLRGRARMRWGERLEFTSEAGPGDFIYVPPHVPHQEINASEDEPLSCVVVRSDQEAVVVNLNLVEVADPAVAG